MCLSPDKLLIENYSRLSGLKSFQSLCHRKSQGQMVVFSFTLLDYHIIVPLRILEVNGGFIAQNPSSTWASRLDLHCIH